jgi:hypothetical protein
MRRVGLGLCLEQGVGLFQGYNQRSLAEDYVRDADALWSVLSVWGDCFHHRMAEMHVYSVALCCFLTSDTNTYAHRIRQQAGETHQ